MTGSKIVFFAILSVAISSAQSHATVSVPRFVPCRVDHATEFELNETGGAQATVTFIEDSQKVNATVFVPPTLDPKPSGVLFSHSAIRGPSSEADLLALAKELAAKGIASITLDGVIEWESANDKYVRSPHLMACAGQWLLQHVPLNRKKLAIAGPIGQWGYLDTPRCMPGESPCWQGSCLMNFGDAAPADAANTDDMLTEAGKRRLVSSLLRCIDSEK
jgi:hypothetical protein